VVRGFGDTLTTITHTGTIHWVITDDQNIQQHIIIKEAYFVPGSNIRLLSPQHWAQTMQDNTPNPDGTWYKVVLYWNQQKHQKTINLDSGTNNIATMWSASGTHKFQSYCTQLTSDGVMDFAFPSNVTPDQVIAHDEFDHTTIDFDLGIDPDQDTPSTPRLTASDELIHWHRRYSHLSMKKIQHMASKGLLPRRIATCTIPLCQSCLFGKMTRKAWRTKPTSEQVHSIDTTKPGECISVDQLESPHPGLIGQMKGTPTRERYTAATVFVDHFSGYT
jgi:GAG-pre-integrase domain